MSINSVFRSKSSGLRPVKPEKCEFTVVNDHFEGAHNENIGLYGQTLIKVQSNKIIVRLERCYLHNFYSKSL